LITSLEPSLRCWERTRIGFLRAGRSERSYLPIAFCHAKSEVGCGKQAH
jgi:hypothetical protein